MNEFIFIIEFFLCFVSVMVLDVLDLEELSGRLFDLIIDKGTLDCILVDPKP